MSNVTLNQQRYFKILTLFNRYKLVTFIIFKVTLICLHFYPIKDLV